MHLIKNILIFFLLTYSCITRAQDWAGPDTVICGGTGVMLGLPSAPEDYCYHWTPVVGLSSAFAKRPLAQPQKTTEYTLTAVAPD